MRHTNHACGLMFHHFCDDTHPKGQGAICADEFRKLIEYVGIDNILPPADYLARARDGSLNENHRCLTFDDNLQCQYDVAVPVLKELGLTALFFAYTAVLEGIPERTEVYRKFRTIHYDNVDLFYSDFDDAVRQSPFSDFVEEQTKGVRYSEYLPEFSFYTCGDRKFRYLRDMVLKQARFEHVMDLMIAQKGTSLSLLSEQLWMNAESLAHLAENGNEIGLHSHTHPTRLELLTAQEQDDDYQRNLEALQGIVDAEIRCVAHPCNSYTAETLDILRAKGVRWGFRANMELGFSRDRLLEMPRIDHCYLMKELGI